MTVTPFTIDVPQSELDELLRRLQNTRWPDAVVDDDSQGTSPVELLHLLEHWGGAFDWRAAETRLNAFEQALVEVDGQRIHVVRAGTRGATPLLLVHGWPDGVIRFVNALPHLSARFDIVVPSVPGYGFSDRQTTAMGPARVADLFAAVMSELGLERFGVHGADIGAGIADHVALRHPDRVIGLHLGDIPMRRMRAISPEQLSDAERDWNKRAAAWESAEGAYGHQQRTKPQTLAAALNDSPAGLASWILEKFHTWSDGNGDVFSRFTPDELATNLTIYWVTQTAGSAARYYFDTSRAQLDGGNVTVPTGVAVFPKDLLPAPRASAERWYPIVRWTEMPAGGHFGPWEEPVAWSTEITAFFDQLDG